MRAESIVFAVAGAFFGLIVGWMLGAQQAAGPRFAMPATPTVQTAAAPSPAKTVDENQLRTLRAAADANPKSAGPRVDLGNFYSDAERYDEAITWYSEALALDPRNVDASTDLGIAYYYSNQPDRALKQFDYSLSVNPKHAKTIFNLGVVRARGKQDLDGATAAWQKLVDMSPESQEGQAAKQMLDRLKAGHAGMAGTATTPEPAATPKTK
jgi:tetratricopeptide (TPR) repeat protein